MDIVPLAADVALGLIALALIIIIFRLARGPTIADRVVALDLMATSVVCAAAVHAIRFDHRAFLDVALVLALVAFISTVAFARYLERGHIR
jgi:multicomponent Na+:H+ antiporter subunit F